VLRLLPAQEGLDDAHVAAAAGTRMLWRFWLFGLGVDSLDGICEWRVHSPQKRRLKIPQFL
jgi:hypothetical protein